MIPSCAGYICRREIARFLGRCMGASTIGSADGAGEGNPRNLGSVPGIPVVPINYEFLCIP